MLDNGKPRAFCLKPRHPACKRVASAILTSLDPLGCAADAAKGEDVQAGDRIARIFVRHQRVDECVGAGFGKNAREGRMTAGECPQ
jgi:hypothetical protein